MRINSSLSVTSCSASVLVGSSHGVSRRIWCFLEICLCIFMWWLMMFIVTHMYSTHHSLLHFACGPVWMLLGWRTAWSLYKRNMTLTKETVPPNLPSSWGWVRWAGKWCPHQVSPSWQKILFVLLLVLESFNNMIAVTFIGYTVETKCALHTKISKPVDFGVYCTPQCSSVIDKVYTTYNQIQLLSCSNSCSWQGDCGAVGYWRKVHVIILLKAKSHSLFLDCIVASNN